jgi:hypothetical protein
VVPAEVSEYCDEVIITEDHGQIGDAIARVEPSAIFALKWNATLASG